MTVSSVQGGVVRVPLPVTGVAGQTLAEARALAASAHPTDRDRALLLTLDAIEARLRDLSRVTESSLSHESWAGGFAARLAAAEQAAPGRVRPWGALFRALGQVHVARLNGHDFPETSTPPADLLPRAIVDVERWLVWLDGGARRLSRPRPRSTAAWLALAPVAATIPHRTGTLVRAAIFHPGRAQKLNGQPHKAHLIRAIVETSFWLSVLWAIGGIIADQLFNQTFLDGLAFFEVVCLVTLVYGLGDAVAMVRRLRRGVAVAPWDCLWLGDVSRWRRK